ncbi:MULTISPECIES: tRNA-(ms[2]io[6]A)-hydroxylase [Reichenbachiella]|uniref:tRNA-(Ms[2]io[6]A)-hydroxylase n=1 Tax=Reichenbachiella agariperforans TaxID=156994 RepID=A0A1M6KR85_REIAG|nr:MULTISPECIES: tRNA-(ms[2]io[6]A)-hydroxylase [Reichenbachiella]MBU2913657.1 tRNA-(ms[2]io[6]A)-hydroxylase [Reichenbachiella agariperforans]RJE74392.1 tRNA hydroxylase [Reichenbachiella sp. MSK19-1]SHJ61468.1 tRNA-(ms[2]io[6]A)-hydroxylase [Reichenbachiella agariperforans]
MQLRLPLVYDSSPEWVKIVLDNFDEFLQDHADCERKASAMAMSFVAKFPDRLEIIPELIDTAVEELEHFRSVYEIMEKRGIQLRHEIREDLYMKKLIKNCRSGREERFLDRLLLASVVENRGAERFKLVYEHLEPGELKKFYQDLWASEAKHGEVFVKLALNYFKEDEVFDRLTEINEIEGKIMADMPLTPALH